MRTPLLVVTGVDPVAMDATLMSLSWDLPDAVVVRHRIDPHSQVLTRTVSDASGVLEQEHVQLEHACVGCALREDILPTLERLGRDGRWRTIVSGLPTSTEAGEGKRLRKSGRTGARLKNAAKSAASRSCNSPMLTYASTFAPTASSQTGTRSARSASARISTKSYATPSA